MIPTSDTIRTEKEAIRTRLDLIRARWGRIAGDAWTRVLEPDVGERIDTRRAVVAGGRAIGFEAGEAMLTFDIEATLDEREALANAREDVSFLLDCLDRAVAKLRGLQRSEKAKNYATEAAMKINGNAAFRKWLCGEEADADSADARLKIRLGISSKADLNTDGDAARRWRELVRDYDRGGRRP
tara:strand:+ start:9945 stop:10496 length:552 start_codon:yes stop_codon:yes gene_type:complete